MPASPFTSTIDPSLRTIGSLERTSRITRCPLALNRPITSAPTRPRAPVTNTCLLISRICDLIHTKMKENLHQHAKLDGPDQRHCCPQWPALGNRLIRSRPGRVQPQTHPER